MRNQEFLILPADDVAKLLSSDDLNVPNEETIFHALVMWAKHDTANRRKHLAKLLAHIKLPLMAPQVTQYETKMYQYISGARPCAPSLSPRHHSANTGQEKDVGLFHFMFTGINLYQISGSAAMNILLAYVQMQKRCISQQQAKSWGNSNVAKIKQNKRREKSTH